MATHGKRPSETLFRKRVSDGLDRRICADYLEAASSAASEAASLASAAAYLASSAASLASSAASEAASLASSAEAAASVGALPFKASKETLQAASF